MDQSLRRRINTESQACIRTLHAEIIYHQMHWQSHLNTAHQF